VLGSNPGVGAGNEINPSIERIDRRSCHCRLMLRGVWTANGAFDAVVFQLCGQRPVAEIAADLATKLKLGLETKPPEEQIAAAKAWFAERRALLVVDDIWEDDVKDLAPGPPVSLLCTSRRRSLPWISPAYSLEVKGFSRVEAKSIFRIYLGDETLGKHRDAPFRIRSGGTS
jgi:hypothetical protein